MKQFILITSLFGIGFSLYLFATHGVDLDHFPKELQVFIERSCLLLLVAVLSVFSFRCKLPFMHYWQKPQWNNAISFPFIWSGFHHIKTKYFLFIALTSNILIFLPFIIDRGWTNIQSIWLLAIIFSLTNAILEELIWRGYLLSRFSELLGEKWAIVLTSLGFGLQHYSLGFPWGICLAFSIGGFFYAGITVKTKSIFPALIWHISLNILMVISGLIEF